MTELEILDVTPLCNLRGLGTTLETCRPPIGFFPSISNAKIDQTGKGNTQTIDKNKGIQVLIEGSGLFLNNLFTSKPTTLIFKQVDSSGSLLNPPVQFELGKVPVSMNNNGTSLTFELSDAEMQAQNMSAGDYHISVKVVFGETSHIGHITSGQNFSVKGLLPGTAPSGGFRVFSTDNVNDRIVDWVVENQTIAIEAGTTDLLGVTAMGASTNTNLTVEIGGVNVPVLEVVEDFIAFGIPSNVPSGIQDVVIRAAGGNVTFARALQILTPTQPSPSPSSSPPPGGGSTIPVRVSFPGGAGNTRPAFAPNIFSVLTQKIDSFGNTAQWVSLVNIAQEISLQYPNVPDIQNPGQTDAEVPLKIDIQVANNDAQGGIVTVLRGSQSVGPIPTQEGTVHSIHFIAGASEVSGSDIRIKLNGTNSSAQVIYVIKAEPQ